MSTNNESVRLASPCCGSVRLVECVDGVILGTPVTASYDERAEPDDLPELTAVGPEAAVDYARHIETWLCCGKCGAEVDPASLVPENTRSMSGEVV